MLKRMLSIFCIALFVTFIGGLTGNAFAYSAGQSNYACFEDSNGNIFKADIFDFGTGNNNFMVTGWAYMKNSNCKVLGVPLWPMMGSAVLMGNTGSTLMGLKFNSPDVSICQNVSGTYMVDNTSLSGSGKWSREDGTWGSVNFNLVGCPYAQGKIDSYEGQQADPALVRATVLLGRWHLIATSNSQNSDSIDLTTITNQKANNEIVVQGTDVRTSKLAIGVFSPSLNAYTMMSEYSTDVMNYYVFQTDGNNVLNGCFYLYQPSTESLLSSCLAINGTKSALVARAEALQENNGSNILAETVGVRKAFLVTPEDRVIIDNIQELMSRFKR